MNTTNFVVRINQLACFLKGFVSHQIDYTIDISKLQFKFCLLQNLKKNSSAKKNCCLRALPVELGRGLVYTAAPAAPAIFG